MSFAGYERLKPMARISRPPSGPIAYTEIQKMQTELQELKGMECVMRYVCTFENNHYLSKYYFEIHAYDEESARRQINNKFGNDWGMLYKGDQFKTPEEKAGVYELGLCSLTDELYQQYKKDLNKEINITDIGGIY